MTTWAPIAKPSQTWSKEGAFAARVFDPYVFDNIPIFDTGSTGGIWVRKPQPAGSWIREAAS